MKQLCWWAGWLIWALKHGKFVVQWLGGGDPVDPNGNHVARQNWGLDDPRLDAEWARIGGPEPLTHVLKNIVIEHAEMDKHATRRAVGYLCLIGLLGWTMAALIALLWAI